MEQLKAICKNPWCKATFYYTEEDMIVVESDNRSFKINTILDEVVKTPPCECKKCRSFSNELSAGVEWNTKEYEGSRFDGLPHETNYKVTNWRL